MPIVNRFNLPIKDSFIQSVKMAELRVSNTDEQSKTTKMTGPDARGEFRELFKIIAEKLSADESYVTHQNIW